MSKKIAILGASGHIAKGLVVNFSQESDINLFLFARSQKKVLDFIRQIKCSAVLSVKEFSDFDKDIYDVVINAVGINNDSQTIENIASVFSLTEHYDNLIMDYLEKHPAALYVNFSSGSVYGKNFDVPADNTTLSKWDINNLNKSTSIGIAKLFSEAKHRAFEKLNIVDLRVFGYFSSYIDLRMNYLLAKIISAIKARQEFVTNNEEIVRDYIHPSDLFQLIQKCVNKSRINDSFDAYSKKPIAKSELLAFFSKEYGLKVRICDGLSFSSLTGTKANNYYSTNGKARQIGYEPAFTSLECIERESKKILRPD